MSRDPVPPPPPRDLRGHVVGGLAVLGVSVGAVTLHRHVTARDPSRGYTPLGLWLGGAGTALFLGVALYALRKRAGQEWRWLPGRLQTWLRAHAWMSAAGLVLVLLHAGLHLDGGSGTWTMGLLGVTFVSGLVGGWLYVRVPGAVAAGPRNLAAGAARTALRALEERMEDLVAGRSAALVAEVERTLGRPAVDGAAAVPAAEREVLTKVRALAKERREVEARIAQQERLRPWLRGWLWVHVPVAVAFLVAVPWHAYDALELEWAHRTPAPGDFADPATCAVCHPAQHEEWLLSSHVTAQSSPIMDLQYRAVMAKERREQAGEAPVATLCVTCHAPLGQVVADPSDREPLDLAVERRAPASRTGISCVTCHQIDAVHRRDPGRDPEGLAYVNMENLSFTEGRTMIGPLGADGDPALPSVGNAAHRGVFGGHMLGSEFCASCHTVRVVKPPQGTRKEPARVVLQNTYEEWRTQFVPLEEARGIPRPEALSCMACHAMDLSGVAALARTLAATREPLKVRRERLVAELRGLRVDPRRRRAAEPEGGFDLPLPPRRRFLHTFVGVDLHLEDDQPLLGSATETPAQRAARRERNAELHKQRRDRTADLLAVAAGLRVLDLTRDGTMRVEVGNLATGHKLPAGFAFAREFWLEVSVLPPGADSADDRAWRRWVGGTADGKALPPSQALPRDDPNVHNLQAVLFDGDAPPGREHRETVLQTEVTAVLTGKAAQKEGFLDREAAFAAGEERTLTIRLTPQAVGAALAPGARLRVRMLFRNLPVEFLERLAARYEGPGASDDDRRQAARARGLVGRLQILPVTEDVVDPAKVLR